MARMSYLGSCIVDGITIPCTSLDSAAEVNINFHDHVVGLKDKNFTGSSSKGPGDDDTGGGYKQIQKKIYRYSPGIVKAKMSGPVGINNGNKINIESLIENAIKGNTIALIDFIYIGGKMGGSDGVGHSIANSVIESLNISLSAGSVVTFDIGLVAKIIGGTTKTPSTTCTKLLTWDKCSITTILPGDIQAFNLSIKNTVIPIYTSSAEVPTTNYYPPTALRLGMQEVSGSISTYNFNNWTATPDTITLTMGSKSWKINVLYQPTKSSASGGSEPYISNTSFIGASDSFVFVEA